MPAFVGNTCRVYFQISDLNSESDIKEDAVQVQVRAQNTNESVLNTNISSGGIMLKTLQLDNSREGKDKYYIEINNTDINGNSFALNKYYKIQIRFTKTDCTDPPGPLEPNYSQNLGEWLSNNDNILLFSQWSSVVLIFRVSQPINQSIKINGSTSTNVYVYADENYVKITGEIDFGINDKDSLQKYQIKLFDANQRIYVEDSGEIYLKKQDFNGSQAEFDYICKTVFKNGHRYYLRVYLTSQYGLQWSVLDRDIVIIKRSQSTGNMKMELSVENNSGRIKIILNKNENFFDTYLQDAIWYKLEPYGNDFILVGLDIGSGNLVNTSELQGQNTVGFTHANYNEYYQRTLYYGFYTGSFLEERDKITIRRSSSITSFQQWDLLTNFEISESGNIVELSWYDYTAEPGLWYKYQILKFDSEGTLVQAIQTADDDAVMLDPDHIFLNAEGEELIIKFDPNISNITTKTSESITDTLGSKYPFIRKNGNINYRTFSLSGTISCFMDMNNNVFNGSKEDIYKDSVTLYNNYNEIHNVTPYNDFIYERHFRDKVIKFLQSNSIKLFRSLTQGNILVKLSNVTLNPNQTLGRRIYSFSCTAYEIGECTQENYDKYNIVNKEDINIIVQDELFLNEGVGS